MATAHDMLLDRYPHIRFAKQWTLDEATCYALGQCDAIVEAISGLPMLPDYHSKLLLLSLQKGAQATTAIEGNTLSDEDVARVAQGEQLPATKQYEQRELQNVIGAFNALLKETVVHGSIEFISQELLLRFHEMIGRGLEERFAAVPGRFASGQRVVGPYRAPAPEDVPELVERLGTWLRDEFHFPEQRFSEAVVQAIVTHVYVEWIHPFDDGNGRTGRLVEFYILLRAGLPSIATHLLANHYNETRPEYYRQLQRAKQQRDLTEFLQYAVAGLRDGLLRTLTTMHQNALTQMWRVLVYDRFGPRTKERREVFQRRRMIALSLPLGRFISYEEVPQLAPSLKDAYRETGSRTLLRDISELAKLNLIRREPGLICANTDELENTKARRRRSTTPARAN